MATIDDSTFQAVANANYKNSAEAAMVQQQLALANQVQLQSQQLQNAISHQKRFDGIMEVAVGQVIKGLIELDPVEASAQVKAFTGNDVASQFGQLGTAIAAIQQLMKGAQSTPPATATPAA